MKTNGRRPQPYAARMRSCTFTRPFFFKQSVCAVAAAMVAGAAGAAPVGEQVTAGQASVTRSGSSTLITQTTDRAAINWQSFNIASNEAVRFAQPSASSIALNRVLGQNPTTILGGLSANGQVFILNPNGVLFGAGAQVTVGGLLASSLGIGDSDFMGGRYSLANAGSAGAVVNAGDIIANGGYVALIAPQVRNEGRIVAANGNVSLAAADRATLHLDGNRLVGLDVAQGALNALAENRGLIQADGGAVLLTARAADALIKSVVNNEGVIEANTLANVSGTIRLLADGGTTRVAGTLSAAAPSGGNGGFIETSGGGVTIADGTVITTAAPLGRTGTWLIDPLDFTIASGVGGQTATGVGATTLGNSLNSSNVTIVNSPGEAEGQFGNINVQDTVTWTSANTLTLTASNNISFQQAGNGLNGVNGNVILNASGSILASGNGGKDVTAASLNATVTNFGIGSSKAPLATSVGALTLQAKSDVFINNAQSVILNTSNVTLGQFVLNNTFGPTGTVTLAGSVAANREGLGLQIVASRFVANPGATLSAGAGGRWVVWSTNPSPFSGATPDQRGDLVFDFKQYNTAFGGELMQGIGNGFAYTLAPNVAFTLTGVTKVYDGTTGVALSSGNYSTTGLVDGDQISVVPEGPASSGNFNFANASNNPITPATTVTANGSPSVGAATSSTASGSKPVYGYAISKDAASGAGAITQRPITITANTNTRTYNGGTGAAAIPTLTSGAESIAPSQSATLSEVYSDANAGTGKTLLPSVVVLAGDGVTAVTANYLVTAINNTTGVINQRPITITAQPNTKTYDGTTAFSGVVPTLLTGEGSVVEGQTATYAEVFANRNAGTEKTLIPSVVIKAGATDVTANYLVTANNNTAGVINVLPLTVTAAGNTKVFDGTASAAGVPLITGGVVATGDTASFSEIYSGAGAANAGSGKTLTPSGSVTDGNGGLNYAITFVNNTGGVITARPLTVTAATNTKVFDGGAGAAAVPLITSGTLVEGSTASFAETYTGAGAANAGSGKTLTPSGAVIDGNGGLNYAVTFVSNTTGVISARPITVTAAANTKVYDGGTSAAALPVLTSGTLVEGNTGNFVEVYSGAGAANAGTGKTLIPSGSVTDGNGGLNYAVTFVNNTAGVITARPITVTAAANTKVFDGTAAAAAVPTVSGGTLAGADTANFSESYTGAGAINVGSGKTLSPSGLVNDGNGGLNYAVSFVNNTGGVITAKPLTISANNTFFISGTAFPGFGATGTGLVAGDTLASANFTGALVFASPASSSSSPGAYVITPSGLSSTNYSISYVNGTITVFSANINIDDILASLYSPLEKPEFPDPGDKNNVNVENGGVNTAGL